MNRRILLVHFTPPGVVGGVEHILQQHVRLLTERGYLVQVVAGRQANGADEVKVIQDIDVARPDSMEIEHELERGVVSARFHQKYDRILFQLAALANEADVIIVHNAFTLHFNLPLTAALWTIAEKRAPDSVIAWTHDLAWTNPLYIPCLHDAFPWNLLRRKAPNTQYVTVSELRLRELCDLWKEPCEDAQVIPNGIDPSHFLRLSPIVREIVHRYHVFDSGLVLLLPVRITRRKNIELGMRAVAAIRDQGHEPLFLISGPVAPHHPGRSRAYLDELKELRSQLGLQHEVVFLSDDLGENLGGEMVSELYSIADVLLFPSEQEGFGLPLIEAGLGRVPVVVSDIPIFREVGGDDAHFFALAEDPVAIADSILAALDNRASRLYRRIIARYRWESIFDRLVVPLIDKPGTHEFSAGVTN